MAIYVFENITQGDANLLTSGDVLAFTTSSVNARNIAIAANAGTIDTTTITVGTKSLSFDQVALQAAARNGGVVFSDSSALRLGTSGNDTAASIGTADPGESATVHAFAGNDTVNVSAYTVDTFVYGLGGADNITGSSLADHLYGYNATGGTDGNDTILAGLGNDYVQGNAGVDSLEGGDGSDRIQGGDGNDTIWGDTASTASTDTGNDTINGNKGNDTIDGGAGNDQIRGGQGADSLLGGAGDDVLLGDLGNDTLNGGAGVDFLTGGDGADIFQFSGLNASVTVTPQGGTALTSYETALDYADGLDEIRINGGSNNTAVYGDADNEVLIGSTGASFTSVSAARVYAQQLIDAGTGTSEIAVVKVGSDTYLFYDSVDGTSDGTIDSIVKLSGVTDPSLLTSADFS